jgi:oligoendopeptidase F
MTPISRARPFSDLARPASQAAQVAASSAPDLGVVPEWDLSDLYKGIDDPAVTADLDRAAADARRIKETYQGKLVGLAGDGAKLAEAIAGYEQISDLMGKLGSFAGLLYAANQSDPARAKFYGDVSEKLTRISTDLIFFELELNQIDENELAPSLGNPTMASFKPWIEDLRKEKPFQLDEKIEQLFTEKSQTGRGAFGRLFSETMTGLRFDVAGEPQPLALEATLNLLSDTAEPRRRAAAEALSKVFKDNIRLFTLITNTLAKDKEISDRWRGFQDVADSRHLANRVEAPVVNALVESVRQAYPRLSHRYYALKAKVMGLKRLDHWDRNAPLQNLPPRRYGWKEARDMVLDSFHQLSPTFAAEAKVFFDQPWIDARPRQGKTSGAYSHPVTAERHPYVFLNFMGERRDVLTLAHELGHAVHQRLASPLGTLLSDTPLTLAETASIFGEGLVFERLLGEAPEAERRLLLAGKIEDGLNSVVRQIAFHRFETRFHGARLQGELSAEHIGGLWLEVMGESLGPAVRLNPGYEHYWAYISHFVHAPFYVYAYAFGNLLVEGLMEQRRQDPQGFVPAYEALLAGGGARTYVEALQPFGIDPREKSFWDQGCRSLERLVDEFEALT